MATEDKKMNAGSVNPADTRGVLKDFYEQDAANGELAEDKKQELLKELVDKGNRRYFRIRGFGQESDGRYLRAFDVQGNRNRFGNRAG